MSKKQFCPVVTILLILSLLFTSGAAALNYSGSQENDATFETLEETRASSPLAVANLETNVGKTFKSHPVLDGYPQGTTFVYRSADLFGGRAAARLNTNVLVFSDKTFPNKEDALAYLKELGLTDIIDEAIGSVVLVTPSNPETGFGAADQKYYYALQTALLSQKASEKTGDVTTSYSDAEYFGGYGYTYVVGIDGGATFLNNYVAGTVDYVSRIAGLLLVGGGMDSIREVASLVPAYLVNPRDDVLAKYKSANEVDAYELTGEAEIFFNQARPLQRVVVAREEKDTAAHISDAYYGMFIKAMRVPVIKQGLYSAGTPYQGYNFDQAPYSLNPRNAFIGGVTEDGIHIIRHKEETYADIKTSAGEYLQTWFEYLPEEVLNNTAPAGSIPLVLANQGGGDDPRVFVDEIGLLELSGRERFAIVAPEEQYIGYSRVDGKMVEGILPQVLPLLIKYMLETYPALDASRVYVTGYSMGGGATLRAIHGDASLFAAAVPMAAAGYTPTEEQTAQFKQLDLPIMFTTSAFDLGGAFNQVDGTIAVGYQDQLNRFMGYNEMDPITFDFAAYDKAGFKADKLVRKLLNNEYENTTWILNNKDGVPMVGVNFTDKLVHALYPQYGEVAWDFMKHYSRNQETGAIVYNPFAE